MYNLIARGVTMKKKFVLSFVLSFIFFAVAFTFVGEKIFSKSDSFATIDENINEELEGEDKVEPKVKDEILFLMMGVDAEDVKKSKGTRTDTMMLFKVNFETGEINLLSIPRDTRVLVRGKKDKINKVDIVGFLHSLAKMEKEDVGIINLKEFESYVAVASDKASAIAKAGNNTKIKGKKVRLFTV